MPNSPGASSLKPISHRRAVPRMCFLQVHIVSGKPHALRLAGTPPYSINTRAERARATAARADRPDHPRTSDALFRRPHGLISYGDRSALTARPSSSAEQPAPTPAHPRTEIPTPPATGRPRGGATCPAPMAVPTRQVPDEAMEWSYSTSAASALEVAQVARRSRSRSARPIWPVFVGYRATPGAVAASGCRAWRIAWSQPTSWGPVHSNLSRSSRPF